MQRTLHRVGQILEQDYGIRVRRRYRDRDDRDADEMETPILTHLDFVQPDRGITLVRVRNVSAQMHGQVFANCFEEAQARLACLVVHIAVHVSAILDDI